VPAGPGGRHEQFDHGADVGVRGIGPTEAEAFRQAGLALFALVCSDPAEVGRDREQRVELHAESLEELLFDFLNELVFVLDVERLVAGELTVEIGRGDGGVRLVGRIRGETYDPERHGGTVDPKGATYTDLRVAREGGQWVAECVIDV
jgi:SHS2 domain-containing protein